MRHHIFLIAIIFSLAGCGSLSYDNFEYQNNYKKWTSASIKNYSISEEQSCFCYMPLLNRKVVVKNGEVEKVMFATKIDTKLYDSDTHFKKEVKFSAGDVIPEKYSSGTIDIEQAFRLIKEAIEQNAYIVEVSYDETYGYPKKIFINYEKNTYDDEWSLSIYEFHK
jgi:hypothetical protein